MLNITVSQVVKETLVALPEMSNEQLAALYIAIEAEHVNRMAAHAGYEEQLEEVF
jgi:hypothetical protein